MPYELLLKQSFRNQLRALPKEQRAQILDKLDVLYDDPAPDGHLKKKIHQYKDEAIFRLRSGDYRILYTYGEGWVKLLWVEHRATVYQKLRHFEATILPPEAFADVELAVDELAPPILPPAAAAESQTPLPVPIDADLLARLDVPQAYHAALLACATLEDLVRAPISEAARALVFDNVTALDVGRVLEQPEYVVPRGDDLLRFKEGGLVDFLLKLSPDQERFVTWSLTASGPTLVKGGPGSGKSTVALYRVRELLRVLRAEGQAQPRILFTTYTNALVTFSRQLLRSLLGEDVARVDVRTADSLAREIAGVDRQARLATATDLRQVTRQAIRAASFEGNALQKRAQIKTIDALDLDYLIDEISDVIEARQLTTLEAYLAAPRPGRTQPLNDIQRRAVWQVRQAFLAGLTQAGLLTWQQVRSRAEEIVRSGRPPPFDAVIIDEGQDLDPSLLRMLIELCRAPNRLFVTADANQSIYSSGFRWSDVHEQLQFKGRTGVLRVNYRSTREIGEAAHSYLGADLLDTDQSETYLNSGPQPATRAVASQAEEIDLLTRFLPAAAREARLGLGACAILCPTKEAGQSIATALSQRGLEATFMTGQDLDLARQGIKVLTLKSAKGLEFPVVALAGFLGGSYPNRRAAMTDDDWEDALAKERRTVFVSMTRAMRALLVIAPAQDASPLLRGFDGQCWNLD